VDDLVPGTERQGEEVGKRLARDPKEVCLELADFLSECCREAGSVAVMRYWRRME